MDNRQSTADSAKGRKINIETVPMRYAMRYAHNGGMKHIGQIR